MLLPQDYGREALFDETTRSLFDKIEFVHGGKEYDDKYPEGIPTTIDVTSNGQTYSSGLVMFPGGHGANTAHDLKGILAHKFRSLGSLAIKDVEGGIKQLENLPNCSA